MRGLLLISMLIALAIAGYLHTKNASTVLRSETETAETKIQQVEEEVNAAMEQHMELMQRQMQQE
jgi:hypothetical protein